MYAEGRGVSKDDAEVLKWYGWAASSGYAPAQLNLALMYESGPDSIRHFRVGSRSPKSRDLDSHLLQDLGLSRVITEHAETDHLMQKSTHPDSCNNSDDLAA
jgi:TPR repeat protein